MARSKLPEYSKEVILTTAGGIAFSFIDTAGYLFSGEFKYVLIPGPESHAL